MVSFTIGNKESYTIGFVSDLGLYNVTARITSTGAYVLRPTDRARHRVASRRLVRTNITPSLVELSMNLRGISSLVTSVDRTLSGVWFSLGRVTRGVTGWVCKKLGVSTFMSTIVITTNNSIEVKVTSDGRFVPLLSQPTVRCALGTFRGYRLVGRVMVIYHRRSGSEVGGVVRLGNFGGISGLIGNNSDHTSDIHGKVNTYDRGTGCCTVRSNTEPLVAIRRVRHIIRTTFSANTTALKASMGSAVGIISNFGGVRDAPVHSRLHTIRAPRIFRHSLCHFTLRGTNSGLVGFASSYSLVRGVNNRILIMGNGRRGVGLAAPVSVIVTRDVLGSERRN